MTTMKSATVTRFVLAVLLGAVWIAGVTVASERSASSMASAANKFLGVADGRTAPAGDVCRSNPRSSPGGITCPAQQFPRNGLPIGA